MALTAYMSVTGKTQGLIKGDCDQSDPKKKDSMLVYQYASGLDIPTDTHTGQPTGQRIHSPLTVVVHFNVGCPKLARACSTGEQCTVEIYFFAINPDGKEANYATAKLEEAIIVSFHEYTTMTLLSENKPYHDMVEVKFTYSKITWTHNDGNVEYADDWKNA